MLLQCRTGMSLATDRRSLVHNHTNKPIVNQETCLGYPRTHTRGDSAAYDTSIARIAGNSDHASGSATCRRKASRQALFITMSNTNWTMQLVWPIGWEALPVGFYCKFRDSSLCNVSQTAPGTTVAQSIPSPVLAWTCWVPQCTGDNAQRVFALTLPSQASIFLISLLSKILELTMWE